MEDRIFADEMVVEIVLIANKLIFYATKRERSYFGVKIESVADEIVFYYHKYFKYVKYSVKPV